VQVALDAGPDLVSLAVANAAKAPAAVFFPYRYADAAERWLADNPGGRAAVLGGAREAPEGGEAAWFQTDGATDAYRAGLFIALSLAEATAEQEKAPAEGENGEKTPKNAEKPPEKGEVYVFQGDRFLSMEEKEAFSRGLSEGGWEKSPVYPPGSWEYSRENIAFAAVFGKGGAFFRAATRAPFVIAAWADPASLPADCALILDDSAAGVAVPAFRLLEKGEKRGRIPSRPEAAAGLTKKTAFGRIKRLMFAAKTADN
jgi:hypothetical protein